MTANDENDENVRFVRFVAGRGDENDENPIRVRHFVTNPRHNFSATNLSPENQPQGTGYRANHASQAAWPLSASHEPQPQPNHSASVIVAGDAAPTQWTGLSDNFAALLVNPRRP